jgi:hypothetical protein
MEKITFTSEESAELQRLYGLYADATPLALYVLHMKGTGGFWAMDKVVNELWRKINALAIRLINH